MPAFNVGVNSSFEQQRQVINSIAVDVDQLKTNFDSVTSEGLVVNYSKTSGVATVSGYAANAGVATYATSAGVSTYATLAGVSTYSGLAGVSTYAVNAGVATNADYATIAGSAAFATVAAAATNADYATQAGEAAFAPFTGISTYAGVAGIATAAEGLTGSPNIIVGVATANLFVGDGSELLGVAASTARNLTGSPDITVTNITAQHLVASGVVTAAQFVGDGSGLTNLVASGTGIVIQEDGTNAGTASTINFTSNLDVSLSQGIANISLSPSLNVSNTTSTNLNVTGITTLGVSTASTFSADEIRLGSGGSYRFYLTDMGGGSGGKNINIRNNWSGGSIYFDAPGEHHFYRGIYDNLLFKVSGGCYLYKDRGSSGSQLMLDTSELDAVNIYPGLDLNNSNIINVDGITANQYYGSGIGLTSIPAEQLTGVLPALDGSNLTGVIAEGSGVVIQDDGVQVGAALTINFGDYLSVSSVTAGIVTVTGQQGGATSPGLFEGTDGVGIGTASKVGIGTTVPTEFLTVKGNADIDGFVSSGSTVYGSGVKLTGINTSLVGTGGTVGDIKMILGYPFYHDGVAWREFYLKEGALITESADTDWDNVILRLDFNTSTNDQSQYTRSAASQDSTVDVVASPVKFGEKSLRIQEGVTRYNHISQDVFEGAWTIEFWVYFDRLPAGLANQSDCLISKSYISASHPYMWMLGAGTSSGNIHFYWKNDNRAGYDGTGGVDIGVYTAAGFLHQWNHIALVRESENGSIHFYVNGVESIYTDNDEIIDNNIVDNSLYDLRLGYSYISSTEERKFDGLLDDLRISTIARYTSNFTAPTAAYPLTGTVSGPYDPPAQGAVVELDDLSDVVGTPSAGQVLKYNGTNWAPATDLTSDSGTGIALTDLSVTTNPLGVNALSYDNVAGTFTFTPTSLVGYATEAYVNNAVAGIATVGYVDNAIVGFITSGASGAGLTALTGASEGTYGDNGNSARITVDANGRITNITQVAITTDGAGVNVSGISTFNDNVSFGSTITVDGSVQLAGINTSLATTGGVAGDIKLIAGAPFFHDGTAWREFALTSGTSVTNREDPYWDSVIFRANWDNTTSELKFGDAYAAGSGISTVASPVKFGTTALRLQDGSIRYNNRSEYVFEGEWTIEGWVYFDTLPGGLSNQSDCIVSKTYISASNSNMWMLGAGVNSGNMHFYWINLSNSSYSGTGGVDLGVYANAASSFQGQWNHIALVREPEDGSLHFYLNGIESPTTNPGTIIDNNIIDSNLYDLYFGYAYYASGDQRRFDGILDDWRISTKALYTSNFTAPTAALPISGTPSVSYDPPGDKYGEMVLGGVPTWTGSSGVTPSQVSDGNYRLSFSSNYTNANDYIVLVQPMDQGYASYVGVARSTTHVDISINKMSDNTNVDIGSMAIQISNK